MVTVPARRGQRGFAALIAIAALAIVSCAVALVGQQLLDRQRSARLEDRHLRLTALADAGLAESLAHLHDDHGWTGQPVHTYAGGSVASRVSTTHNGLREVVVSATWSGWSMQLVATVVLSPAHGPQVVAWHREGPSPR